MAKHILVVDDEMSFRFASRLAFRQVGFDVSEAVDGYEALKLIVSSLDSGNPYDMLLLDIQMPNMTGIELYNALKELGISIPVIFISGYADGAMIEDIEKRINGKLLQKPFESQQLVRLAESLLNEKGECNGN